MRCIDRSNGSHITRQTSTNHLRRAVLWLVCALSLCALLSGSVLAASNSGFTVLPITPDETASASPDLKPYKPANWNYEIPISITQPGAPDLARTYNGPFYTNQVLYINAGIANVGSSAASGFLVRIEVTGTGGDVVSLTIDSLAASTWTALTEDMAIGPLSAGTHTCTITVDSRGSVAESNESNNTYTRTITVAPPGPADIRITPTSMSFTRPASALATRQSVSASPNYYVFKQPDGTPFVARQFGDEYHHWMETKEGHVANWNSASGRYEYQGLTSKGSFEHTGLAVGIDDAKAKALPRHLRERSDVMKQQRQQARQKAQAVAAGGSVQKVASLGTLKALVILANFSDTTVKYGSAAFNGLFNTPGYSENGAKGSVVDYYKEDSYNKLTVQATTPPWVNLPHPKAFYGANTGPGGEDAEPQQMVTDAIAALNAKGFDFAPYDTDGSGEIDAFSVIHQGPGEEAGGGADAIWSHSWAVWPPVSVDGIQISDYHTEPEQLGSGITTIGVIAHETGHAMGLPDLYDTDYSSEGVGDWDIMASGSWNDNGRRPAHMGSWCKTQLGWMTPTLLSSGSSGLKIPALSRNAKAYKITQGMAANEYLLVENRQLQGFDDYLPGSGLIVTHVDESMSSNDNESRYLVAVLQADGQKDLEAAANRGDAGDSFPGSSGNRTLGAETNPNTDSYDNGPTDVLLNQISDSASTMTFNLSLSGALPRRQEVLHRQRRRERPERELDCSELRLAVDHLLPLRPAQHRSGHLALHNRRHRLHQGPAGNNPEAPDDRFE